MKRILLFFFVLIDSFIAYSQELQLHSFKESTSDQGMANLTSMFIDNWPKDGNGKDCALIRVGFENFPNEDIRSLVYHFGNTARVEKNEDRLSLNHQMWLYISVTNNAYMEAQIIGKGTSNRLSDIRLESKHIYDVILKSDRKVSIVVLTKPDSAIVTLESGQKGVTPNNIPDVQLGKHTLTISLNGVIKKTEEIEVTEHNTKFGPYELRAMKEIRFTSDPSGAMVFLEGEQKGKTPLKLLLPYDSYNVEAKLGPGETDTRAFTVSEISVSEIKLEPIKKKKFVVYAMYGGEKVNADLYIDREQEGSEQPSYSLEKPIGKTYRMNMIYQGNSRKRTIKVRNNMDEEQEFKISAKNSYTWPWQLEYDACPMGFSMGYVTKQWVTKGEGVKIKENVWGEENKRLHGLQVGLHGQPCLSWGLGIYFGLFYEYYMAWSDEMKSNGYLDKFNEHNIYVPVHAYYRIPFAKEIALSVHGGIGMDCGIYAEFASSEDGNNTEPVTDYYGEDACPKRFNLSTEIGLGFRIGPVQVNALYSKGLTDHKFYTEQGNYKTIQNKLGLNISWVFSAY